MPTPEGDGDEDFEFLVNLLASDGVDPDTPPTRLQPTAVSSHVDSGLRIQSGPDGRLDLGQVRTFYEKKKNVGVGAGTGIGAVRGNPGLTDLRHPRNRSGSCHGHGGCISRCARSCCGVGLGPANRANHRAERKQ